MNKTSRAAVIVEHLGGEKFLATLGARDFAIDDSSFGFTFVHDNPKGVHSVVILVEPRGGFKVICYGRIAPGTFHAPMLGSESVAIAESLAAVLGKLTGIDAFKHRHL